LQPQAFGTKDWGVFMKIILTILLFMLFVPPCFAQTYIDRAGAYPTTASSWVVIDSNYAYVIDSTNLLILNIADRTNPIFAGSLSIPGQPHRMDVKNGYAYLAAGDSGLQIVDATNPSNPHIVGTYSTEEPSLDIVADNNYAYLLDFSHMRILDISNPTMPNELGEIDSLFYTEGLSKKDCFIYMIYWPRISDILYAVNVSDPYNPYTTSYINYVGEFSLGLNSYGDDLYQITSWGIIIWDISNQAYLPQFPAVILSLPNLTWISADGNFAFASQGQGGLSIIERGDRDTAFVINNYDTPGNARHVVAKQAEFLHYFIYVADNDSLQILSYFEVGIDDDQTVPTEFARISNYPNPFNPTTTIQFDLPKPSQVSHEIYDLLGRKIETLVNSKLGVGPHSVLWDGKDRSSGIYFYKIQAGDFTETQKMLLLK
jgi:hypothetical protein